ncbi:MAG: hypothetical protein LQ338_002175 [Usnochroma carphineum]|nr:MAG: hypothetical protein LQ338_002175 [Usnochroma carphineum]
MKTFTILALLLAAVSATPVEVVERDPDPLEKRDTEIVYLANCISAVSCCTPDVHYSQIIVGVQRQELELLQGQWEDALQSLHA